MSNIIEAVDVQGGSVLRFARRDGTAPYYFYPGISSDMASLNPQVGGQRVSDAQAELLKGAEYAEYAEELL